MMNEFFHLLAGPIIALYVLCVDEFTLMTFGTCLGYVLVRAIVGSSPMLVPDVTRTYGATMGCMFLTILLDTLFMVWVYSQNFNWITILGSAFVLLSYVFALAPYGPCWRKKCSHYLCSNNAEAWVKDFQLHDIHGRCPSPVLWTTNVLGWILTNFIMATLVTTFPCYLSDNIMIIVQPIWLGLVALSWMSMLRVWIYLYASCAKFRRRIQFEPVEEISGTIGGTVDMVVSTKPVHRLRNLYFALEITFGLYLMGIVAYVTKTSNTTPIGNTTCLGPGANVTQEMADALDLDLGATTTALALVGGTILVVLGGLNVWAMRHTCI